MRLLFVPLLAACHLPDRHGRDDTADPIGPGAADTAAVDTPPDDTDADAPPTPTDADGDGHPAAPAGDDCDDAHAAVHPGALELCGDGVDQDCAPSPARCAWWGEVGADHAEVTIALSVGEEAWLGAALAGGDDLTGDGVPDLAIGAPQRDLDGDGGLDGAVHVLSGAEVRPGRVDADALHARLSPRAEGAVGLALALGHDGDGAPVLLAGSPWQLTSAGVTGVVFRPSTGPLHAGAPPLRAVLFPPAGLVGLGVGLATSDLDGVPGDEVIAVAHGDGEDALLLAPLGDPGSAAPTARALRTSRHLDAVAAGPGRVAWGWHDDEALGVSVLFGPFPDGDDLDALDTPGAATATLRLGALGVAERTVAVAALPDVTGDGVPDLAVGLPCRAATCATGGDLFVLPGGASVSDLGDLGDVGWAAPGLRLVGGPGPTALGRAVGYAGDVDGDGYGDLLVGEPGADGGRGAAWLLYGPLPDGAFDVDDVGAALPGARFVGVGAADGLGAAVSTAGDVDLDGRDDVAITALHAPSLGGSGTPGRVYLLRGRGE